ncbi:hypothetical protein JRO89_XS12G0094200 [Xanthoceras sorbifolium]|uniref:Carbonic anhydrase n=1 Tax=Xanthoceras sorbifolium TaxID=99658 RepID=A0ABQ8HBY9_9ROSI|nr:hypothetical protein JRO89_XS12G0094200 [Xanthoceras sorbifolium]
MISKIFFSVVAISLFLGLALDAATIDEEQAGKVDFSYKNGSNGPSNWGKLKPEFSACSSGKNQSPVNILKNDTVYNKNLTPLSKNYTAFANATLINWGFIIGLHYNGDIGGMEINGKKYAFKQLHWHSPSEHLIDGQRYDAEMHLVHEAEDRSVAVSAILYQYGDTTKDVDPFLAKLNHGLEKLSKEKCEKDQVSQIPVGMLSTKHITRSTRKYYRYVGSFTTPPCTENVIWTVLSKARSISKEQVAALKAPLTADFKDNARPEQELNGRQIELYDELKYKGGLLTKRKEPV